MYAFSVYIKKLACMLQQLQCSLKKINKRIREMALKAFLDQEFSYTLRCNANHHGMVTCSYCCPLHTWLNCQTRQTCFIRTLVNTKNVLFCFQFLNVLVWAVQIILCNIERKRKDISAHSLNPPQSSISQKVVSIYCSVCNTTTQSWILIKKQKQTGAVGQVKYKSRNEIE